MNCFCEFTHSQPPVEAPSRLHHFCDLYSANLGSFLGSVNGVICVNDVDKLDSVGRQRLGTHGHAFL